MTEKSVSDEQLGNLSRKQHEIYRRVREGTLPIAEVLPALQRIIEGKKEKLFTFTVPDLNADQLIAEAKKALGINKVDNAYTSDSTYYTFGLKNDRAGKKYEAMTACFGKRMHGEEVKDYFSRKGFRGNLAVFLSWLIAAKPSHSCLMILPESERTNVCGAHHEPDYQVTPAFWRTNDDPDIWLGTWALNSLDGEYTFVAFREVE